MRVLVWLIALALVAAALALAASGHPGNVALLLPPYRVDLSLNLALLLLLAGFALFYAAIRGTSLLLGLPQAAARFRARRRTELAASALHEALLLLLGGRFRRAEVAALKAAEVDALRPGALLTAAQAAQAMQAWERRDAHLAALPAQARDTAQLLLAQYQLEAREPQAASATLRGLSAGMHRRTQTLRLQLQCARALNDHAEALRLALALLKHRVLHPAAARAIIHQAALGLLRQSRHDVPALRALWKSFDAALRVDAQIASAAARALAAAGAPTQGRELLVDALRAPQAEPALLMPALRGMLVGIESSFVAQVEIWIQRWPQEAQVAFLAGRVCAELELWGKAQQYLNRALELCQPDERRLRGHVHAALGRLFESIEREDQAQRHWRLATLDLTSEEALPH